MAFNIVWMDESDEEFSSWLVVLDYAGAIRTMVPFYEGKVATARYFFRHHLPNTRAQADLLASLETSALDVRPGHF